LTIFKWRVPDGTGADVG